MAYVSGSPDMTAVFKAGGDCTSKCHFTCVCVPKASRHGVVERVSSDGGKDLQVTAPSTFLNNESKRSDNMIIVLRRKGHALVIWRDINVSIGYSIPSPKIKHDTMTSLSQTKCQIFYIFLAIETLAWSVVSDCS